MQKTIQTIHHRAARHIAKTIRFLSPFSITLSVPAPLQLNIVLLAGIRFRTLTKETRVIQSHARLPSSRRAPWRSTQPSGLITVHHPLSTDHWFRGGVEAELNLTRAPLLLPQRFPALPTHGRTPSGSQVRWTIQNIEPIPTCQTCSTIIAFVPALLRKTYALFMESSAPTEFALLLTVNRQLSTGSPGIRFLSFRKNLRQIHLTFHLWQHSDRSPVIGLPPCVDYPLSTTGYPLT
jgi:hypothetical protein